MFPEMPDAEASILDNPYQYTDYKDESQARRRRGARRSAAETAGTGAPDDDGRQDMAGRGTGPDFVEALARGLDVLACFDADHRSDVADRGGRRGRAGPARRRAGCC